MRKLDSSEVLLASLLVYFGALMVFCAIRIPSDGTTFTGLLGLAAGLSGALCLKIKQSRGDDEPVPPGTEKKTVTVEKQATPAEPPKL